MGTSWGHLGNSWSPFVGTYFRSFSGCLFSLGYCISNSTSCLSLTRVAPYCQGRWIQLTYSWHQNLNIHLHSSPDMLTGWQIYAFLRFDLIPHSHHIAMRFSCFMETVQKIPESCSRKYFAVWICFQLAARNSEGRSISIKSNVTTGALPLSKQQQKRNKHN